MKPGGNPETGRQQLQTILNARIRAQTPNTKVDLITQLTPIREVYAGKARLPLLLVLAASSLLLLTACTNIANLFLVRAANRSTEFATRVALGAGRARMNLPIAAVRTMREIVSESLAQRRFQMILISLFAFVAVLLGAVGIYGVVSYSVACRTREVGLRIALGAMTSDVMRSVFSAGMKPVLAGLLVGLGAAIAIATALRSLLYGITPADPLSLGVVAVILLFTSGIACYIPARRAARLDPIIALRHE